MRFAPWAPTWRQGLALEVYIGAMSVRNYVLSPLVWEPSEAQSCPVFGSAEGFAAAYREAFGEEPLAESAAAAAGGMALLAAIQEVRSLQQEAVRQALQRLSLQTCYGLLLFDENGTRWKASTLTQQAGDVGERLCV